MSYLDRVLWLRLKWVFERTRGNDHLEWLFMTEFVTQVYREGGRQG
jgi:hypothetical protein